MKVVVPNPRREVVDVFEWHRALRGEVSVGALALALVLSSRMNSDGSMPPRFTPSVETLSRDMGYAANSRRGVVKALRELEERGFLAVERPGRRQLNRYQATVPVGPTVADAPLEPVAEQLTAGGQAATLPTQPTQFPTPALPTDEPGETRELANGVLYELLQALPFAEAQAVNHDLYQLRERDKLRDAFADLVRAGHRQTLLRELLAVRFANSPSPYAGATHPGRLVWKRTQELQRRLPGPS